MTDWSQQENMQSHDQQLELQAKLEEALERAQEETDRLREQREVSVETLHEALDRKSVV